MKLPCVLCAVLLSFLSTVRAQVRITEVNVQGQRVELTNFGATTVNLATWQWCRRFAYSAVGGNIAPGQSREFTVSMNAASSDIGLYRSGLFGSAADMEDFVQYGAAVGGGGRESVAVAKGIWSTGQFLPLPGAGLSLNARGAPPAGSRFSNWFTGRTNPGVFPVPGPALESFSLTGGEWRLVVSSHHLAAALKTEANSDFSNTWALQSPVVVDLGGGRFDIRFPAAAGGRQFTRVRAAP